MSKNYIREGYKYQTTGGARQTAPHAKSAWQACNSEGLMTHLRNRADDPSLYPEENYESRAQRYEHALFDIVKENPAIFQSLPNYALSDLANAISWKTAATAVGAQEDPTPRAQSLISEIYRNYDIYEDPEFETFDLERRITLGQHLQNDPIIQDAQANWDSFSLEQKMDVVEHVHTIQTSIYETPPSTIEHAELDGAYGSYLDKLIKLDTEYVLSSSFEGVMDVTLHEGEHAFHDDLKDRRYSISRESYRWSSQVAETPFGFMDEETYQNYQDYMAEWVDQNLPGGMNSEVNQQLLQGGGLAETAEILFWSWSSHEVIYDERPTEQHAWAYDGFTADLLANPNTSIKQMQNRLDELQSNVTVTPDYPHDTLCSTLDRSNTAPTFVTAP